MTRPAHQLYTLPEPSEYSRVPTKRLLRMLAQAVKVFTCGSRHSPPAKVARQQFAALAPILRERGIDVCAECGCTDIDCSQCVKRTCVPCYWVRPMLCSACAGIHPIIGRTKRGRPEN